MIPLVQLWHAQTSLIFPGAAATQGQPDAVVNPGPDYELVTLTTKQGIRIVAQFGLAQDADGKVVSDSSDRPTVIYFHGNGSCLADLGREFSAFRRLGVNVIFPEYQGYGMSEGKPGERACYATADAAFEYLLTRSDIDAGRIILVGRSLGSAVAIDLAARQPVSALIAISAFTSIHDMGRRTHPGLPTRLLLRHKFDSLSKISKVTCPMLFIHGARDTFVPTEMADQLAGAAKVPVSRYEVSHGNHTNVMEASGEELWKVIGEFVQMAVTPVHRVA